jgi:hypothetical protein
MANMFLIMPTKYIKLIKRHYIHYHAFDIHTHIYYFVYGACD